jgi:C1A family cysteine protease
LWFLDAKHKKRPKKAGICKEKYFPYVEHMFVISPLKITYLDANFRKIGSYSRLSYLVEIKQYLAIHEWPVMTGSEVRERFLTDEVARTGIIPLPKEGENLYGGHAITIVGYDEKTKMMMALNSWAGGWGMGGFCLIPYAFLAKFAYDRWTIQ